jgi:Flp pilus assembly protein TadD
MVRTALSVATLCAIVSSCSGRQATQATFAKDVAPIVFANCASCHRPGGDAPFSLTTYRDAADHAAEIAHQTHSRHMPPWLPEPGDVPIAGVRRLNDTQIETIQRWVRDGAPEGNASDLPPLPSFAPDWQLGTPDLVLTMPRPYVLQPGDEDVYRNVILQGTVPNDVFIRAVELRRNGSPIHHAMIRLARPSVVRTHDGEGGQPGFSGMGSELLYDPEGQSLGWAPGRGPIVSHEGMPWRLARGTAMALELHLVPGARPVDIQPIVALYFSRTPPSRTPVAGTIVSKLIDIPAGAPNHVVTNRYTLPVPADLISVFPHAHYLGREILVTATAPGTAPTTLLHIKHWSFHWQQEYRYVTPLTLPRGTVIDLRFTYDNSSENPANPHHPPMRVRLGPRSTDEMANLTLQFVTASPADSAALRTSFLEKNALDNITYAEGRVREAPDSVADRVLLGASYVQVGRFADAIPHLTTALRLDPRHAVAESQLGGAYLGLGRMSEAVAHFRQSARLAPDDPAAEINLGQALEKSGRVAEAMSAYRRAVAIDDDALLAHVRLGELLDAAGRASAALPHFRRVVELRPDWADAHNTLASVLAAAGLVDEAVRHLRRALELDPNHVAARQNLALLGRGGGSDRH